MSIMDLTKNKYLERIINSYPLQQLIFCIVYYLLLISDDILDGDFNLMNLAGSLLFFTFGFLLMEFNLQVLVKRFLARQQLKSYLITVLAILVIYCGLIIFLAEQFFSNQLFQQNAIDAYAYMLIHYFILLLISMLYRFNFKYIAATKKISQLQSIQKEQKEAELMALKSQINPHFLFNTLNNIYSFSVTKKPNTATLILKLSELTSYVLYDSDRERVSISDEVSFLANFIELERIRIDERVQIEFQVELADPNLQVAPLLLIPLVENIFNHGLHRQSVCDFAKIKLTTTDKALYFNACNTFSAEFSELKKTKHGIGLKNLKKRLELIYPDHLFNYHIDKNIFNVDLTIHLN